MKIDLTLYIRKHIEPMNLTDSMVEQLKSLSKLYKYISYYNDTFVFFNMVDGNIYKPFTVYNVNKTCEDAYDHLTKLYENVILIHSTMLFVSIPQTFNKNYYNVIDLIDPVYGTSVGEVTVSGKGVYGFSYSFDSGRVFNADDIKRLEDYILKRLKNKHIY